MQRHDGLPQLVEYRVEHLLTVIPTGRQAVVLVRRSSKGLTCTELRLPIGPWHSETDIRVVQGLTLQLRGAVHSAALHLVRVTLWSNVS